MFKIRDRKVLIRVLIALQLVILASALVIHNNIDQRIAYAHDRLLMEELSGAGVIAGLNHKERFLVIIASSIPGKEICKIIKRHNLPTWLSVISFGTLDLDVFYLKSKKALVCSESDLDDSGTFI